MTPNRRPHVETVLQVLQLAGDVEWARLGLGSDGGPAAPLVVWRYVVEPSWFAETLSSAVGGYDGELKWIVEKPGRNWVLWPEREKLEFEAGAWRNDSEYFAHLAAEDPDFCTLALHDLAGLLLHPEAELESGHTA